MQWPALFPPMLRLIQHLGAPHPAFNSPQNTRTKFLHHPGARVFFRYRIGSLEPENPGRGEPRMRIIIGMPQHKDQFHSCSLQLLETFPDKTSADSHFLILRQDGQRSKDLGRYRIPGRNDFYFCVKDMADYLSIFHSHKRKGWSCRLIVKQIVNEFGYLRALFFTESLYVDVQNFESVRFIRSSYFQRLSFFIVTSAFSYWPKG